MELQSTTERVTLIDPAGNRAEQVIEHRVDPLDGTIASFNTALGEKARAFLGSADVKLLEDMEQGTRATCPFCAAAEKGTRFLPAMAPEGQIRIGDALAMPNLFSKCALDAVVVVDPARHVLFPSRLSARALGDAVRAAGELVRRARAQDPAVVHHIAGMNFLAPSGSSVPHAHFQVHVRGVPYSGLARARRLASAWAERAGRSYFDALLEAERARGERWVGTTGAVQWIAAWAPAHQKEFWGVLPGTASLVDLRDEDAAAFGEGIARVVRSYEEAGTHPFTFAFHSSPDPATSSWALHVRICARPAFRPLYVNYETWFGPKFFGDDVHTEAPEAYAARLRARW